MRRISAPIAAATARSLNIHEYAAKECMREYKVPTEKGYMAASVEDARKVIGKFSPGELMVKAQVLAGGRGKGEVHLPSGTVLKGGVKKCTDHDAALKVATDFLGSRLVTKQTGANGEVIHKVYITETVRIQNEKYVALVLDRRSCCPLFIGCSEGGMSIEEVAANNPDAIHRMPVDLSEGIQRDKCIEFAQRLGFSNAERAAEILTNVYNLAKQKDCTMVEINPMAELVSGEPLCLDAKISIDDNAEFRQKEIWAKYQDLAALNEREVAALKADLNYVALDGNVGCIVNGAGLAMATMDMIATFGASPANFLDTGGNATATQIESALRIITSDTAVTCILVNIFGGITRCDLIADGIIEGIRKVGAAFKTPVVVRLEGTFSQEGRVKIEAAASEGLPIIPAATLDSACSKVSEIAKSSKK